MPFVQSKLEKITDQTRNIFDLLIYKPDNGDSISDVTTVGYFSDSRFIDEWDGSVVSCALSDGYFNVVVIGGNASLSGTSLTQDQVDALNDYIATDFIRMTSAGPQAINTTSTTIELGDVLEGNGITYNSLNESITFPPGVDRLYSFNFLVNGISAGNNNCFLWAESFNGVDWVPFPTSGQELSFGNNDTYKTDITSILTIPGGTEFRFRAKTDSGTVTLGTSFMEGADTIQVLASVLAVASIGPNKS